MENLCLVEGIETVEKDKACKACATDFFWVRMYDRDSDSKVRAIGDMKLEICCFDRAMRVNIINMFSDSFENAMKRGNGFSKVRKIRVESCMESGVFVISVENRAVGRNKEGSWRIFGEIGL